MRSGRERLALGLGLLAALWVVVYWAWPVEREPAITFADEPAGASEPIVQAPVPAPVQPPPVATRPPPERTPATAFPERPRVGVVAPEFTTHTVRAGESFQTIAKKAYGDAALWSVVARANPRVDPRKLRVGQELRLPVDPNNVQGLTVGDPKAVDAPPPTRAAQAVEYIVQPGDTLGAIAKTYYNSSALWQVILDANRSLLSRPQDLRPGMKLLIPPDPRGATGSGR
ncbi:MAG: LysM peptidoglycan-binding domain-containing protein [Phycisphaerales bacterium]|nr:LysM peptidoglycan-binding domain-containing protein [Phycisphaerales bacterium]